MNSGWFRGPVLVGALVVVAVVVGLRQGHATPAAQGVKPVVASISVGPFTPAPSDPMTFKLSSVGPDALKSLEACLPDNCEYIERDRARRVPLSAADQRGAQAVADQVTKAVPGWTVETPSCAANGQCEFKVGKPAVADVRTALQNAGISDATVRAATAADPAAPGYVVAAVPHGKACVLVTVGGYNAAAVSVVGRLRGGTCLAPATK